MAFFNSQFKIQDSKLDFAFVGVQVWGLRERSGALRFRFAQSYLAKHTLRSASLGAARAFRRTKMQIYTELFSKTHPSVCKFGGWGGRRRRAPELGQFLGNCRIRLNVIKNTRPEGRVQVLWNRSPQPTTATATEPSARRSGCRGRSPRYRQPDPSRVHFCCALRPRSSARTGAS